MFDTPFDRYHDEAAAERREQEQFDEREQDGGYDPAEVTARQPKSRLMRVWMGVLIVLAAITAWWVLGGGAPAPAAAPLPVVTVATPLQKEITEWDEFVGRFEASRRVEVRPQVSGQITAIHFTDGQFVRQGAPLFTIDARTYRASLAQAQAQVAQATTALALSRDNLARAQRLVEDDAVAANEIDRLKAEVRNNEAGLAAARALVSTRALDVGFTTVRAPISGRISDRRVDAGNLVSGSGGSQATLLTTINAVDPVYFEFTGSEALFLKAQREGLDKGTPVEIRLQDETEYTWHGKLDFTDNGLDDESGTIRARALVDNPDGFLTPGLFGQMRHAQGDAGSRYRHHDRPDTQAGSGGAKRWKGRRTLSRAGSPDRQSAGDRERPEADREGGDQGRPDGHARSAGVRAAGDRCPRPCRDTHGQIATGKIPRCGCDLRRITGPVSA